MTPIKAISALTLVAGVLMSGAAEAHRGGVRFGFHFGVPLFYPAPYWYYAPPPAYYYPAPVVTAPAAPPVYIEQNQSAAAPPAEPFWYYCADSQTYYPYVQTCRSEWQRVSPRPPGM